MCIIYALCDMDKAIYFDYDGANIYRMSAIGARLRELQNSFRLLTADEQSEQMWVVLWFYPFTSNIA